jgi:hypothetical protein
VRAIIDCAARYSGCDDSGRMVGNPYLGITSGLPVIRSHSAKVPNYAPLPRGLGAFEYPIRGR